MKPRLTKSQIEAKAITYGIEPRRLLMIVTKEANRSGFLPDGRPKILFEAHKFHKHTGGIFDTIAPNLSSRTWNRSLYRGGAGEWVRMDKAIKLRTDGSTREAALKSASWGIGQILGSNYLATGCKTVQEFVNKNFESEEKQLDLMINFLKSNPKLWKALNRPEGPDFATVALHYNGTQYKVNNYDKDLEKIYENLA